MAATTTTVSLWASHLRDWRYGDEERKKRAIATYGAPVRTGTPSRSNGEILVGRFPRRAAVAGLVHDAVRDLYQQELAMNTLGLDPDEEEFYDQLRGRVTGESDRSDRLLGTLGELEKKYGIDPGEVLQEEAYGQTVDELLHDIARNRAHTWEEDVADILSSVTGGIDGEERLSREDVSGRADLVIDRVGGTEIREIKVVSSLNPALPRAYDEHQAKIYYWAGNFRRSLSPTVDYPVQGERYTVDVNRVRFREQLEEDRDELREAADTFREDQAEEIERRTGVERRSGETLEAYRRRLDTALDIPSLGVEAVVKEASAAALERATTHF